MFYKNYSDEELIAFFSHGMSQAWETFHERYIENASRLASIATKTYKDSDYSYQDFYSLAMSLILTALDKYTPKSMSFYSYWKTIVFMEFQKLVYEENSYNTTFPLLQISLDETDEEHLPISETLGEIDKNIYGNVMKKEIEDILIKKIDSLSENEKKVLIWLGMDMKPKEIMTRLNYTKRQYYRLKNKLRENIDIEIFKNYFK
jgi:DNA-directed RNA polymerase specialized sigma subunit